MDVAVEELGAKPHQQRGDDGTLPHGRDLAEHQQRDDDAEGHADAVIENLDLAEVPLHRSRNGADGALGGHDNDVGLDLQEHAEAHNHAGTYAQRQPQEIVLYAQRRHQRQREVGKVSENEHHHQLQQPYRPPVFPQDGDLDQGIDNVQQRGEGPHGDGGEDLAEQIGQGRAGRNAESGFGGKRNAKSEEKQSRDQQRDPHNCRAERIFVHKDLLTVHFLAIIADASGGVTQNSGDSGKNALPFAAIL